ncbi:hypothetical protein DPEC_G00030750 [Dallia pectoralis]|uniref:Uncharacterized protein n=1 Tax=Dallia pectoralis TaxID=75939 RepID=A0ACC2HC68_DALPE|nr:hypothetical protein DPEC_G00030750 [Dallia pectoralis]
MAEEKSRDGLIVRLETRNTVTDDHNLWLKMAMSKDKEVNIQEETDTGCTVSVRSRENDVSVELPESKGRLSEEIPTAFIKCMDKLSDMKPTDTAVVPQDKENHTRLGVSDDCSPADGPCLVIAEASPNVTTPLTPTRQTEAGDEETRRMAREEGRVDVRFSQPVTQEGCCRFVGEILKCVLYQRQQLPMTYDQLVFSQKRRQAASQDEELVCWGPGKSAAGALDWRKCQRTLQDIEEVLQQLEVLFTLSLVPRVFLLLGGSLLLPKELYEINMEEVILAAGDQSLRVSLCLRHLFRTLFVADLLSDAKPVRLHATTLMVLAHRDCGTTWFRPKLEFRVPTRVMTKIINLSCDPSTAGGKGQTDWKDYVWFQTPISIKGFNK